MGCIAALREAYGVQWFMQELQGVSLERLVSLAASAEAVPLSTGRGMARDSLIRAIWQVVNPQARMK